MTTVFEALFLAFVVGVPCVQWVRDQAVARGHVDRGGTSRNIHVTPVPRVGGVAMGLTFALTMGALVLTEPSIQEALRAQGSLVLGLVVGGAAILALGIYDDLHSARAGQKLVVQVGVALLLYAVGLRVESIVLPFGPTLSLGWLALPFHVLWIVGITNAVNLIDGLDGLAGGVALIALVTHFALALLQGNLVLCVVLSALIGVVLAFLVFNSHPATVFMGDTGSLFLGFALAAVSLQTAAKGDGAGAAMLVPILVLGLPILDTSLAIVRRLLMGRSVFSADKDHLHHRVLARVGQHQRRAVLILYGVAGLFSAAALGLHGATGPSSGILALLFALAVAAGVLWRLGFLSAGEAQVISRARRRNLQLRALVRGIEQEFRDARSLATVWDSLQHLAEALNAQALVFEPAAPVREDGWGPQRFTIERAAGDSEPLEVRQPLKRGREALGDLVLVWRDHRAAVDRDEELAIELSAAALSRVLSRLQEAPAVATSPVLRGAVPSGDGAGDHT